MNKFFYLEHVYMRPQVNSNPFEISNRFEKSFGLHCSFTKVNLEVSSHPQKMFRFHGDFTVATCQAMVKFCSRCASDTF